MAKTKNSVVLRLVSLLGLVAFGFTATAPAKATTLADIKKRGVFEVAMEAAYNPFEFVQDGKIVGYDRDVLDRIAEAWGVKLDLRDMQFAGLLTGLQQKKFDLVGSALIMNAERATKFPFTLPVAAAHVILYKRKGDTRINSIADLTEASVGLPTPPSGPAVVFIKYNDELKAKGKAAKKLVTINSIPERAVAMMGGQIDLSVELDLTFGQTTKKFPGKFEALNGTIGAPFYIGWVTRPEDKELRDAVSAEIRKLRDSGELAKLQTKWFGFTMEIPDKGYLPEGGL